MLYSRDAYLAWIASAGLPPDQIRSLFDMYSDLSMLYESIQRGHTDSIRQLITQKNLDDLKKNGDKRFLDIWERKIKEYNIHTLTSEEASYPVMLKQISNSPAILFYQGRLSALEAPSAAMVGSRSASWKGLTAAEKIARDLSENGIVIISGLAYGIDAAAHKGCLQGGSPTVAVLGCGLDRDYPVEHISLKANILEKDGLLLSEYAPGEKPLGWHFPIRNRIISGLADCLIVMEAKIRSGSMTTVQHALDQGKDIFVYPGEPDNPKSEGNHQLLREGGIYFTSAEDILEDMRWLDKKKDVRQNSHGSPLTERTDVPEETAVLQALSKGERSFEQLCEDLNRDAASLMISLTMMEIKGLIDAMPGKLYRIRPQE